MTRSRGGGEDATATGKRRGTRHRPGDAGETWFVVTNLLLGGWLLLSPYAFAGTLVDEGDDFAIGLVLVAVACYGVYRMGRRRPLPRGAILVSFFAGMWLLAFTLAYGDGLTLVDDNVVAGAALAILNLYLYRRYFRDPWGGG